MRVAGRSKRFVAAMFCAIVVAILVALLAEYVFNRVSVQNAPAAQPATFAAPEQAGRGTVASLNAARAFSTDTAASLRSKLHLAASGGQLRQANIGAPPSLARSSAPPPSLARSSATRSAARSSQLIRSATLNIEVASVERSLRSASEIVNAELGDITNLDYRSAPSAADQQSASMQVRVPQYRLERAVDELARLGKVTSRSQSAQDVTDQIVDAQARLRNLRHTEADILKIMDRYGDIEQVLRVTQELSSEREQIETLDAQLKGMHDQVAYSTITIYFATPAPIAKAPGGMLVLRHAWQAALTAALRLTLGLLSLGVWLVAFSPYLLLIGALVALTMRRFRARSAIG